MKQIYRYNQISILQNPVVQETFSTVDNLLFNSIYQQLKSQKMMLQKIYKKRIKLLDFWAEIQFAQR